MFQHLYESYVFLRIICIYVLITIPTLNIIIFGHGPNLVLRRSSLLKGIIVNLFKIQTVHYRLPKLHCQGGITFGHVGVGNN